MLKVQIETLDSSLAIEVKKNDYFFQFIVMRSKSVFYGDNGKIWHGRNENKLAIEAVLNLILQCYENPSIATQVSINDGISIHINCCVNEKDIIFDINSYHKNSNEFLFISQLYSVVNEAINNDYLKNYLSDLVNKFAWG